MPRNEIIRSAEGIVVKALVVGAVAVAFIAGHDENLDSAHPNRPVDVSELDTLPTHSGLVEEFTTDIESRNGVVTWYTNFKNRTAIYTELCSGLMYEEQFSDGLLQSNYDYETCSDGRIDLDETYPRQSAFEDSLFTVADPKAEDYF